MAISTVLLRKIAILGSLDAKSLENITKNCHLKQVTKGEKIISRRDQSRAIYFVIQGQIRVTSFTAEGKEAFFNIKHPGEVFGELSAIDGEPRTADVVALSEATVLVMEHQQFNEILKKFPEVAEQFQKFLVTEIRKLTGRVYNYTALNVRYRVFDEVYRLGEQAANGKDRVAIPEMLKHVDIASRVATTREAVTREVSRLTKMGLIEKKDNHIVIPSLKKLKAALPEN